MRPDPQVRVRLDAILSGENVGPIALVVAHPDDETLFACALLLRQRERVALVHLTDGAPADPGARGPGAPAMEEYARQRRRELKAVVRALGLGSIQRAQLKHRDQELAAAVGPASRQLRKLLTRLRPAAVFTHSYEGGHPDHDAAALLVAHTCGSLPSAVSVSHFEFASYHAAGRRMVPTRFLPGTARASRAIRLQDAERDRKEAALTLFASQQHVIRAFPTAVERYRVAPLYDFTRAPHEGELLYEQWWAPAITYRGWREQVRELIVR